MRIVHTTLRYPPATGGVESYVRDVVERTRDIDAGRDVRVLTSRLRTHGPLSELDPDLLLDDPPYVQRLHHRATPLIGYPRLRSLSYYLGHHQPTIVHAHGFWYQPADVAARSARRQRLPFFLQPYYYNHGVRQKLRWQLYQRTCGYRTFATADVVLVISPYEQSLIEAAGLPVKRFELVPPGIELADFAARRADPFVARGVRGSLLLAVGRIATAKGLDDVISVLPTLRSTIPDIQFVIAGEDFGAASTLRDLAHRLGVADRVHWWGRLTRDDLLGAYQHANVLVHPSHYEAFGIVPAESLAAGTPVVARRVAALPFVVPHERAGLLFSHRDDLTAAVLRLLQEPDLRARYSHHGQQHVQQQFTWEKTIKKMVGLYEEFDRTTS